MTQFHEPNFGDIVASTSMSSTTRDVKVDEDINDYYPTNANYSKMLRNQNIVTYNNLANVVNKIMTCLEKLESKIIVYFDPSVDEYTLKQHQYGMPYNYYENQGLYATTNRAKLISSVFVTNKAN